jgi:hypothetical protein
MPTERTAYSRPVGPSAEQAVVRTRFQRFLNRVLAPKFEGDGMIDLERAPRPGDYC